MILLKFLRRGLNIVQCRPTGHRTLGTSPRLLEKLFLDKENDHAHQIMRKEGGRYNTFQEPIISSSFKSEEKLQNILDNSNLSVELLEDFKFIASFCKNTKTCISSDRFDDFVDKFTHSLDSFSDEQLLETLRYISVLPQTKSVKTKNYLELWVALDTICCKRIDSWQVDTMLKFADCWYAMNLARPSDFVWNFLKKINRRVRKLSPSQLVHVMFFCNILRKPLLEMFDFELNFRKIIDQLSLDEIGVMSMGFFKTKTPLRDPQVIEKIYSRLINEVSTVSDITLVSLLKVLRYSSKFRQSRVMGKLLDNICPEIQRVSLLSCVHIILMGCDMQQCHPKSIELVLHRFNEDIESARLKDMERVCHVISLYDFETESGIENELMKKIIQQIKTRPKEILQYPKCLPCALHYIALKGFYDEELISNVLNYDFIRHAYGTNLLLGREMFCLDSFVKINLKDEYKGNILPDKIRTTMGRCLSRYMPERSPKFKLAHTDTLLIEIKEATEELFTISTFKHVLPHFERADVVLCFDKVKKEFLPVGEKCPKDYSGTILTRDLLIDNNSNAENIVTIVLICGGWNNYVRNSQKPTGLFRTKLQQLEILGHKPIAVPWFEWRNLDTDLSKQEYLKTKVNQFIKL